MDAAIAGTARPAAGTGPLTAVSAGAADWHYLVGDSVAVLHSAAHSNGGFDFCLVDAFPGGGPPLHTHAQSEVFVVLEGELQVMSFYGAGLQTLTGRPGDAFIVPGGTPHCFRAPQGERIARFVAFLTPGGLEPFFAEAGYRLTSANREQLLAAPPDIPRILAAAERHGVMLWDPQRAWDGPLAEHLPAGSGELRELAGELLREAAVFQDADGGLLLLDCISRPGGIVPLHGHAQQEVFYVLEGAYEFTAVDAAGRHLTFPAPAGTAVFIPPGALHGFRNAQAAPSRALAFFNGTAHRGFFMEAGGALAERASRAQQPFVPELAGLERIVAAGIRHGLTFPS